MGFLSRLLGIDEQPQQRPPGVGGSGLRPATSPPSEQQALERYRYMLRTAPPETVEQAHAEAFAQLSPEQRQQVLSQLAQSAPEAERAGVAATRIDDPQALARVATRAEVRQPGTLERTLGSGGMGMGMGASLLSSLAMGFVGSMVASSFFSAMGGFGGGAEEEVAAADEPAADESNDADLGGEDDFGGGDFDV